MNRLPHWPRWLAASVLLLFFLAGGRSADRTGEPSVPSGIRWHDALSLGIEGRGWTDTSGDYHRLPARAEGRVPDAVWDHGKESAGLSVRFRTNATTIFARWKLGSSQLALPKMPATAASGLDLFVRTKSGVWRWLGIGVPTAYPENVATLVQEMQPGERDYLLYLPLFNEVESLELGVGGEFQLGRTPLEPADRPIVLYGTSIAQGALASRPGANHTAILSRRLDRTFINLGFAGSARMEPGLAKLIAELDPAMFVISCVPNMTAEQIAERTEPFITTLRSARPQTPIVLLEDRTYANASLVVEMSRRNRDRRSAARAAYDNLVARGVEQLFYVRGEDLLGADAEDTVDGSHPSDLGFRRMADALEPILRAVLANQAL